MNSGNGSGLDSGSAKFGQEVRASEITFNDDSSKFETDRPANKHEEDLQLEVKNFYYHMFTWKCTFPQLLIDLSPSFSWHWRCHVMNKQKKKHLQRLFLFLQLSNHRHQFKQLHCLISALTINHSSNNNNHKQRQYNQVRGEVSNQLHSSKLNHHGTLFPIPVSYQVIGYIIVVIMISRCTTTRTTIQPSGSSKPMGNSNNIITTNTERRRWWCMASVWRFFSTTY